MRKRSISMYGSGFGNTWKSMAAGALGGLAASFAMNQFQAMVTAASKAVASQDKEQQSGSLDDDATVNTAKAISKHLLNHELTDDEKKWAGPAVHYALGTTLGAVYGGLAEAFPTVTVGLGTAYGTAIWLGADEIAVPSLGLSQPLSETSLGSHAQALASHLVFGLVTALTRKLVLRRK